MIKLVLLHPQQSLFEIYRSENLQGSSSAAQSWTFKDEPIIRIGRAADNHVVLYSAVVSRRHVELRQVFDGWEIVNLGANGTYIDEEPILQVPMLDGIIFRLARSGPQIQVHLGG